MNEEIVVPPFVVAKDEEIVVVKKEGHEEEASLLTFEEYTLTEDPDLNPNRSTNDDSSLLPPPLPNRHRLFLQQQQQQQQEQQQQQQQQQQAENEPNDDEDEEEEDDDDDEKEGLASSKTTTLYTESLSESERRSSLLSSDDRPSEEIGTRSSSSASPPPSSPHSIKSLHDSSNDRSSPLSSPASVFTKGTRNGEQEYAPSPQADPNGKNCDVCPGALEDTAPGVIRVPGFAVSPAEGILYDPSSPASAPPEDTEETEGTSPAAGSTPSPHANAPSEGYVVATEVGIPHVESDLDENDQYNNNVFFSTPAEAEIIYDPEEEITRRRHADELKLLNKPKNVREKVFGNNRRKASSTGIDIGASPECIRRRDVLKWTVKRNLAVTDQWVTSVQTNQKAVDTNDIVEIDRCIKNFCADSKHHATELGLAMATPHRLPFDENPICYVCKNKFALLRRPRHCRNCGVCICSNCSVTWPAKMIPETYNTKNDSQVNACVGCDWLATMFRNALMEGRFKDAVDLYTTGNVNLRSPFCNVHKKEEILYPIHAAVMGGYLPLVRWLTTNHCCPLRNDNTNVVARKNNKKNLGGPILTSKGRSALGIALDSQNMEIICFLVGEKNMSFGEEKDLASAAKLVNFCNKLVRMLPTDFVENNNNDNDNDNNNNNNNNNNNDRSERILNDSNCSTMDASIRNRNNELSPLPLSF